MRSPDVPLDATSETSEGARSRPRGILPASYTCQTFEFDAAIAWGGVGVGLGVATTKAGVGVAVGFGFEAGRVGVALRDSGVGDTEAKSGVAEGTGIGVASGVGDTVARSGVLEGIGIGVAIGGGLGVASFAARGFSTRMRR